MYSLSYIKRKRKQRKLLAKYENQLHVVKNVHSLASCVAEFQTALYFIDCLMKLNLPDTKLYVEEIDKRVGHSVLSNKYDSLISW